MRAESVAADQELGKAYAQYKGGLQGEQLGLLEKAQETWTAYRDANCRASAAAYEGGTLAVAELDGCKMRLARERIAELKRIYEEPPLPAERE